MENHIHKNNTYQTYEILRVSNQMRCKRILCEMVVFDLSMTSMTPGLHFWMNDVIQSGH